MTVKIHVGDALKTLRKMADESVQCCITSPPYWGLRDYNMKGQIGLEETPDEFIKKTVEVFREVRRVLRNDGTCWINIGDSYAGSWGAQGHSGELADRRVIWARQIDKQVRKKSNTGSIPAGSGLKPKDMVGIPWMLAFALRADGWYLRQDIIWSKPNCMPESVVDRCSKAHEYIFLLAKNGGNPLLWRARDTQEWSYDPNLQEEIILNGEPISRWRGFDYYYDAEAIKEPAVTMENRPPGIVRDREYGYDSKQKQIPRPGKSGNKKRKSGAERGCPEGNRSSLCGSVPWEGVTRNKRSVWNVQTKSFKEAHFATYPPDLIEPCVLAGCQQGGVILDPFFGAGTTGLVADRHRRDCIGIELNPDYAKLALERLSRDAGMFSEVEIVKP